jgi:hypothetical protein
MEVKGYVFSYIHYAEVINIVEYNIERVALMSKIKFSHQFVWPLCQNPWHLTHLHLIVFLGVNHLNIIYIHTGWLWTTSPSRITNTLYSIKVLRGWRWCQRLSFLINLLSNILNWGPQSGGCVIQIRDYIYILGRSDYNLRIQSGKGVVQAKGYRLLYNCCRAILIFKLTDTIDWNMN